MLIPASKAPGNSEPYFFVWCSEDGTNDGTVNDTGELQGATISSYTLAVATGITKVTDNKNAVTIHGVSYAANTIVTVWLSGGVDNTDYSITCTIVCSDGRTLVATMSVPVRAA